MSFLEEQNALLRKEITLIKARYGIPAEQSFLTAEERSQCLQEIKASQEAQMEAAKENSTGSPDAVSSTSPNVYPLGIGAQRVTDEDDSNDRRTSLDAMKTSPKPKEETIAGSNANASLYGPSAYGPFNPSPSWGPSGPNTGLSNYGNGGNLSGTGSSPGAGNPAASGDYSPPSGSHTKLPPISNAFQEKCNSPYGRYINGSGIMGYGRPPYDYFMQYASQNNAAAMLYGTGDMNQNGNVIAPADLSTNRGKKMDDREGGGGGTEGGGITVGTAGGGGDGGRNSVGLKNILAGTGKNPSDLSDNLGQTMSHSAASSIELDDVAAMASSFGQVPRSQESFPVNVSRVMSGGPVQMAGSSVAGQGLPTEMAHTGNNTGIGGPDKENLKRENDALKMAVRSLTAQVEHMKDQVYKD